MAKKPKNRNWIAVQVVQGSYQDLMVDEPIGISAGEHVPIRGHRPAIDVDIARAGSSLDPDGNHCLRSLFHCVGGRRSPARGCARASALSVACGDPGWPPAVERAAKAPEKAPRGEPDAEDSAGRRFAGPSLAGL